MEKYDKKGMQESLEELRSRFSRIGNEEREALERLMDLLHKYRVITPYLSERSKSLEERLNLLMANRDNAKSSLAALRQKLRLMQMKLGTADQTLKELRRRKVALVSRYNAIIEGKMAPAHHDGDEGALSLSEKRERFIARLQETFAEMEREVESIEAEISDWAAKRKKYAARSALLSKKAEIADTKLTLYQSDIRDVLLELNNEGMNEKKLAEEYQTVLALLQKVPDISAWGMKVFAEAVEKKKPEGGILKLNAPVANLLHLH